MRKELIVLLQFSWVMFFISPRRAACQKNWKAQYIFRTEAMFTMFLPTFCAIMTWKKIEQHELFLFLADEIIGSGSGKKAVQA